MPIADPQEEFQAGCSRDRIRPHHPRPFGWLVLGLVTRLLYLTTRLLFRSPVLKQIVQIGSSRYDLMKIDPKFLTRTMVFK